MIELLLQAERALTLGMVDQAERLYRQASDADPRNSIAVVGLARVALERADEALALREARRALAIDPENAAASRLASRLEEVLAYRGEAIPEAPAGTAPPEAGADIEAEATIEQAHEAAPAAPPAEPSAPTPHRGLVDRLLRRNRP